MSTPENSLFFSKLDQTGLPKGVENLLDKLSDGVAIISNEFKILFANSFFEALVEMSKEELLLSDSRQFFKGLEDYSGKMQELEVEVSFPHIQGEFILIYLFPVAVSAQKEILLIIKADHITRSLQYRNKILNTKVAYFQEQLERAQGSRCEIDSIVGQSQGIKSLRENISRLALSNCSILIKGEKGSGKELVAQVLHNQGTRKSGPFVKIRCSGITESNLGQELFGYYGKGRELIKVGKLEIADRGTLYLEDIEEIPISLQIQLLDFIKSRRILCPEGIYKKVDVRIAASTSSNLEEHVKNCSFNEELYFGLNLVSLVIPPLRDRKEDIKAMIEYYLSRSPHIRFDLGRPYISKEALDILCKYNWPGNIKELSEVLERAINFLEEPFINTEVLPPHLRKQAGTNKGEKGKKSLKAILDETEKSALLQTLHKTAGNKVKAAKLLGISRAGLYQKLEKHSLLDE